MNKEFYHKTVTTDEIEKYISKTVNYDLSSVFDQYLRDIRIPTLEYKIEDNRMFYRWTNVIDGFNMPMEIKINNKSKLIYPTEKFDFLKLKENSVEFDEDYYVLIKEL